MSGKRDRAKERIKDYVWGGSEAEAEATANKILSIPELAVVDRKAKLPKFSFSEEPPNMRFGYQLAQQDMLKAGFKYKIIED